jgi:hypothetical protein
VFFADDTPRAELAPWRQWGEGLEAEAVKQMANACALPVAVAGALMPNGHVATACRSPAAAQTDLVEVLGQFDPKLVKMCPAGDRAED